MRVGVQLTGIGPKVADAILSHLSTKWNRPEVIVLGGPRSEGELDGLLLIGDGRALPYAHSAITETVEFGDSGGTAVLMDDLILQVDAKLGRLTSSPLLDEGTRSFLTPGATVSRRDLLTGARNGFRRFSRIPLFYNDKCEAKHGCAKCVEACPAKALRLEEGRIRVNDTDCTACGLCAAVCPVGAAQMPELSETALHGLLDEIDESPAPRKTLVLTCDSGAVTRSPWMVVEQVGDIGMFGPRQIAAAAATSLGGVAVVCPDGKCEGKESAKAAIYAVSGAMGGNPSAPFVIFVEGADGVTKLTELHESSRANAARTLRSGDRWKDYIADLVTLLPPDAATSGLMLSEPTVAQSCTLCSACVRSCPHGSLRLDGRHLYFSASTCTGCGLCVGVCPEHSMTISESSASLSRAMQSEVTYEDDVVLCARCGTPVGSVKFVDKVTNLLGQDAKLVKYCSACKKQLVVESLFGGRKNA